MPLRDSENPIPLHTGTSIMADASTVRIQPRIVPIRKPSRIRTVPRSADSVNPMLNLPFSYQQLADADSLPSTRYN